MQEWCLAWLFLPGVHRGQSEHGSRSHRFVWLQTSFQVVGKLLRKNASMDEYLIEVADGLFVAGKTLIPKEEQ